MKWVLCLFIILGCAQLPPKPAGDLCTVDLPRAQLICCPIAGAKSERDLYESDACRNIPIALADKYVAFDPDTWENVVNYIKQLQSIGEACLNPKRP